MFTPGFCAFALEMVDQGQGLVDEVSSFPPMAKGDGRGGAPVVFVCGWKVKGGASLC
jgi:hypothetical protein